MANFKRDRPTIGIIANWSYVDGIIPDHYRFSIFRGIQSVKRIRQCHLLTAWGVGTSTAQVYPSWPEIPAPSDFVPVGRWNTDGLIVYTPLRNEADSLYLQKLMTEGFPVLFLAAGEKGPTMTVNNREGILQAMAHLVSHGHRSIAFIAGTPDDVGDSLHRLQAYRAAVTQHGLESDPRLVVPGRHNAADGYKAMQELLALRASGVKFTAVMASNDSSAIGAMRAIGEAGLRIPGDIAIFGFDDQPDVMTHVPPLASVHVPLKLLGEQALLAMLDHLTGGVPLESLEIGTRLVPRRSCGCLPEVVLSAADGSSRLESIPPLARPETRSLRRQSIKKQVVEEMVAVLSAAVRMQDADDTRRRCAILLDAFSMSLKQGDLLQFQIAVVKFLDELELAEADMEPWQEIISVLRRQMGQLFTKAELSRSSALAENMLHLTRVALSESALRHDRRRLHQKELVGHYFSALIARLGATLDEHQAIGLLNTHMKEVGIRHARVALFEAQADDPVAWSILVDSDPKAAIQRFPSREFPPPGLYPPDELLNLVLLPLAFQEETFGYAAMDATNIDKCGILVRQLASTFNTARLHAQVVELSMTDALTGVHNRRYFDLSLKNELERSRRFKRPLAVLMLDVDHFKSYNDTFGHAAGDEALCQVAVCLLSGRRVVDVVARIGGEEFGLILPETDEAGALRVAEMIRAKVEALADLKRPVTISIGLTSLRKKEASSELLLGQADSSLYKAKEMGRNRVYVFEENPSETREDDPSPGR